MKKIPTDNYIRLCSTRSPRRPCSPASTRSSEQLRERDGLKAFQRLGGRTLVALDGTEYFCSQKLSCPQCLTRKRSNGKTEHYHAMLAAMIVAPGHNMVLPLMPEFITPQDGAEKQDCERNAAKRWLSAHGERDRGLARRSIWAMRCSVASRWPKRCSQRARIFCLCARKTATRRCTSLSRARRWSQRTVIERKPGKRSLTYRYRWIEGVPLRDGKGCTDRQLARGHHHR